MGILIGAEIEKALEDGSIRIEPLDTEQVGPGSVDLTLGNDFRVFKTRSEVYHVRNDSRFEDITTSVHVEEGGFVVIKPGEMILGITREKITLADTSPVVSKDEAGSHDSALLSMSPQVSCTRASRTTRSWRS